MIFASMGAFPVLAAVNDKSPEPLRPNPISVLSLVHVYEGVPTVLFVVNVTAPANPLQNV